MQSGDLVVERLAALVETAQAPRDRRLDERQVDRVALRFDRRHRKLLDQVHQTAAVAVRIGDERVARRRLERQSGGREVERPAHQRGEVIRRQRLQHVDGRARQQRADHLERRVLGGRADERDGAPLHVRQEGVLLRLVEAVHFVDEQDGRAPGLRKRRVGARDGVPDVLHARQHGGQRDELGVERVGHEPRERGLAHARRSPQDHRVQLARCERDGQRLARGEQVPLPDDVGDAARAQALGQRHAGMRGFGGGEEIGHEGVPRGTPGGRGAQGLPHSIGAGMPRLYVAPAPGKTCAARRTSPARRCRTIAAAMPLIAIARYFDGDEDSDAHEPREGIPGRRRPRQRCDGVRVLLARVAADLPQRRRGIRPVRHGTHGPVVRDAEDAGRAVPWPRCGADGPRAARRLPLHRPRARRRRAGRHDPDGRFGRRGGGHRRVHALPAAGPARCRVRLRARRLRGRRRRGEDRGDPRAYAGDRADRDDRGTGRGRGDRRRSGHRCAVGRSLRPDQLHGHTGTVPASRLPGRDRADRRRVRGTRQDAPRSWPPTTTGHARTGPTASG